jgi:hypothetical protein
MDGSGLGELNLGDGVRGGRLQPKRKISVNTRTKSTIRSAKATFLYLVK